MSNDHQNLIRINKYIADAGVTSRRKADELIESAQVKINGKVILTPGVKINPKTDVISVRGQTVDPDNTTKLYIALHKPRGVMTTVSDPEGRTTVIDLLKEINERIYPIGRLDYLSEGLLILTNDGEFAQLLAHPKHRIPKVYEVKVFGQVSLKILKQLKEGVQTEIGFLKPHSVRIVKHFQNKTWLEFRLHEGKNREIRRICEACELTIDKLKRVTIGGLSLQGIAPGNYHLFSKKQLMKLIGLNERGEFLQKFEFQSVKKTIKIDKRKLNRDKLANNVKFGRYKKEQYYETLKNQKIQEAATQPTKSQ